MTSESVPQAGVNDFYDRKIGSLHGLPDVVAAKPTTIRSIEAMIGASQTFIVQTFRDKERGDTIFIEQTSALGHVRLVLPPNVADAIARQRYALTARLRRQMAKERSQIAKQRMKERMAGGWRPSFNKERSTAPAPPSP